MIMRERIFYLIPMLLLLVGCQFGEKEGYETSDAELIQMIIEAEKVEIDIEELPDLSRSYVENDNEYDEIGSYYASELGYEVERTGNGHRSGHRSEVYFNLDGRKLDPNDWGSKERDWDRGEQEDWKCFSLVFPITFDMPDGSVITVETDDEDGWSDIKSWYEENPEMEQRPLMQFPVVIFFNEESMTIESQQELSYAYHACQHERDGEWKRDEDGEECFELVYPITFTMPDGSSVTVEDGEDGWDELKDWYDENEGYEEVRPELQYPVNIVYETEEGDSTVTVNNDEEMESAKEECRSEWEEDWEEDSEGEGDEECFDYVLPVTFVMPDGSTITVEDEDGWFLLRRWYEENGESEEEPGLQYPVDIVYETEEGNSTVTINNDEEMEEAYQNCENDD
jgi:hypothetical protein